MNKLKFISLFAGIGGFDEGFEDAGMECIGQVEIDKHAQNVLRKHRPNVPLVKDIRNVTAESFRKPDLICGGFPCQDLSVAGKRKGLDGERSGLWFEFHRVICLYEPKWVVIENVPGLLSSNQGWDFAIVLGGLTGIIPEVPVDGWSNSGLAKGWPYNVAWRVLDSQYFGVAQKRRRVFIVGSLGNGCCAEILFESESLCRNPAEGRKTGQDVAGTIGGNAQSGGFRTTDLDNNGAFIPGIAAAERERERVLSLSDSRSTGKTPERSAVQKQHCTGGSGGAVMSVHKDKSPTLRAQEHGHQPICFEPRYARNGRGAPGEIVPPLKAQNGRTGKGDGAPVVCYENHPQDSRVKETKDIAPTLHQKMGTGGGNVPLVQRTCRMSVRRLTSRECERLQGFPDDHTRYGIDENGNEVEISDTQRYRQCGNAVTRTVARWIGERIVKASTNN